MGLFEYDDGILVFDRNHRVRYFANDHVFLQLPGKKYYFDKSGSRTDHARSYSEPVECFGNRIQVGCCRQVRSFVDGNSCDAYHHFYRNLDFQMDCDPYAGFERIASLGAKRTLISY